MTLQPIGASLRDIQESITCSLCASHLRTGPIYTCIRNHTTCKFCFQKLERDIFHEGRTTNTHGIFMLKCPKPTCGSMANNRNLILEKLLYLLTKDLTITCHWTKNGCQFKGTGDILSKHEEKCKFEDTPCPIKYNNNCGWSGPIESIFNHLAKHKCITTTTMAFDETFNGKILKKDRHRCRKSDISYYQSNILEYTNGKGETIGIYLNLTNRAQGDTWIATINYIGNKDNMELFLSRIVIYKNQEVQPSKDLTIQTPSFTFCGPLSYYHQNLNSQNSQSTSFTLTDGQITKYSRGDILFSYDLQLLRTKQ